MSEYMKVPADTFDTIQMDAGILTDRFDPETGEIGNVIGAIDSSGFNFRSNPTFNDFGEDIGNIPPNTWQMLRIQSFDPTASGTYANINNAMLKGMEAGSDYAEAGGETDEKHIVPSHKLEEGDFTDLYVVGNYSRGNTGTGSTGVYAGFVCVHLKHAMNRSGFQWQTTKQGKGKFAFEYHAHYDMNSPDEPPFDYFIRKGTTAATTGGATTGGATTGGETTGGETTGGETTGGETTNP